MDKTDVTSTAALAGIGLAAGLVGAAVMLAGQEAEIALTGRETSRTPAKALEKIGGVDDQPAAIEQRLSTAGHFAFGTALGLGMVALAKVPEPARSGLFFAGAWGAGASLITGLCLSDPPTKWRAAQLATDLGHHIVYAAATGATFAGLRRLAKV